MLSTLTINLRPACLLFLLLALTTGSAIAQQTNASDAAVRVIVTVADPSGRPVSGLTQEQFSVFEKKTPLDISYFDSEDKPVSMVFVFDLSSALAPESRKTSVQLATQIIRNSNKANEYAFIGLKDTPEVFCELGCNEADTAKALQQIGTGAAKEVRRTALYDGCHLALKKLESSKNAKRTLIVFSDGLDGSSKLPLNKLHDALKESDVIFYGVGLQRPSEVGSTAKNEGGAILEELGTVTGGKTYFPLDEREMIQVANVIALQLRQQYTIGFKPVAPVADNKWHSIKIKLTMPKTEKSATPYVRYREGYFSR